MLERQESVVVSELAPCSSFAMKGDFPWNAMSCKKKQEKNKDISNMMEVFQTG